MAEELPGGLTPRDYAAFALEVYNRPVVLPSGWLGVATNELYDIVGDGYHGTAYRKGSQIVIAHRGTDSICGTDFEDVAFGIGAFNIPPDQLDLALEFTRKVATEFPECTIEAHTGHSLGAAIAELMCVLEMSEAVTFESPGTKSIMENWLSQNFLINGIPIPELAVTYANSHVISYNAAPNWINTDNTHVGKKIVGLRPPFDVLKSGTIYFYNPDSFTLQQHSMEGILACFDPTTGQPTQYSEYTPAQWPTDGEAWFRSLADNPHYWEEYFKSQHFSPQQKLDYIADELSEPTPFMQAATIHVTQLHQQVFGTTLGSDEVVSDYDSVEIYKYGGQIITSGTGQGFELKKAA